MAASTYRHTGICWRGGWAPYCIASGENRLTYTSIYCKIVCRGGYRGRLATVAPGATGAVWGGTIGYQAGQWHGMWGLGSGLPKFIARFLVYFLSRLLTLALFLSPMYLLKHTLSLAPCLFNYSNWTCPSVQHMVVVLLRKALKGVDHRPARGRCCYYTKAFKGAHRSLLWRGERERETRHASNSGFRLSFRNWIV